MSDTSLAAPASETRYVPASQDLWWEIQDFLYAEADLLDERRYEEWLGLLHPDIRYRMPLARNVRRDQTSREYTAEGEAAWFDEGLHTLSQRVAQLGTGIHWAEEPASRVSHMVSNVRVFVDAGRPAPPEEVKVTSRFLVYQNRLQTETALFAGRREDLLCRAGDGWKIRQRTVHLSQNVLLAKALTTFF